jgi:microcystin-dependent protein
MTDNFLGEIRVFTSANGTTNVPQGWTPCEGQVMQIAQNQALFSLLGNRFGGDGRVTFCLPDFRGRIAVGWSPYAPASEPYSKLGGKAGDDAIVLTATQVPIHTRSSRARPIIIISAWPKSQLVASCHSTSMGLCLQSRQIWLL